MAAESTVILLLAALPILEATGQLDTAAIARQTHCEGRALITLVQETAGEPAGRWIVIVRCVVPTVPIAEILRTDPWEPPRRAKGPCIPSPFPGWCIDGSRRP